MEALQKPLPIKNQRFILDNAYHCLVGFRTRLNFYLNSKFNNINSTYDGLVPLVHSSQPYHQQKIDGKCCDNGCQNSNIVR